MSCRGVRGATSVEENSQRAIIAATRELLERMIASNDIAIANITSVIFTATHDLDAAYPARAAREMGWTEVPLLCMQEMTVADGLPRCIRVLLLWNTDRSVHAINHVYLGRASALRPDLAKEEK